MKQPGARRCTNLTFAGLKTNLGIMVALILTGGLFTWIMITDGVRDIFFNMSFSFLSVYMQDIASLSISQIGMMNSFLRDCDDVGYDPGRLAWTDKNGERVNIAISFFFMASTFGLIATGSPRQPGLDLCPGLGDRRDRGWAGDTGLPIADQQSRAARTCGAWLLVYSAPAWAWCRCPPR